MLASKSTLGRSLAVALPVLLGVATLATVHGAERPDAANVAVVMSIAAMALALTACLLLMTRARETRELAILHEAIEACPTPFAVYDAEQKLIAWNPSYEELHQEAFARLSQPVYYADLVRASVQPLLPADQVEREVERRLGLQRVADGSANERRYRDRWFCVHKIRTPSGAVAGISLDITEMKARAARLQKAQERFRLLAELAPIGILQLDDDGHVLYVNPTAREMFVLDDAQWSEPPTLAQAFSRSRARDLMADIPERPIEGSLLDRCGQRRHVIALRARSGGDTASAGTLVTLTDITERKKAEEEIARLAAHDSLTGLANRRNFVQSLELRLQRAEPFALISLDLDSFKPVNDTLGHHAGDLVLWEVARRVEALVRANDLVARLGGDEFAVILNGTLDDARHVSNRIVSAIAEPFVVEGATVCVGASAGIARAPDDGIDSTELMRSADIALYRAKTTGRSRAVVFSSSEPLANTVHGSARS